MTGESPTKGSGPRRSLLRLLHVVERVIEGSGAAIIFATLAFTFCALLVNVVLRYAFGSGLAWAYEIHAILFPWLVAGGIAVASVRGWHISVDALIGILPDAAKRAVALLVSVAILVIAVTVIRTSGPIIKASQFQRLSEIPVSQYWGYISLYYAFGAMAAQAIITLARQILAPDYDRDLPQQSFS